jgi:hypothetical protein
VERAIVRELSMFEFGSSRVRNLGTDFAEFFLTARAIASMTGVAVASIGMMAAVIHKSESDLAEREETGNIEEMKTAEEVRREIDTTLLEETKLRISGFAIPEKL